MNRPTRLALTAGLAAAALATVGAALAGPALASDPPSRAATAAVQQPAPDDGGARPDRDCPRGGNDSAPSVQPAGAEL